MRVTVFGLWHLGCVTAACLAKAGHQVVGLDFDNEMVALLNRAKAPIEEPGLNDLIQEGLSSGALSFTTSAREALSSSEIVWVAFDTPVNDDDEADLDWVRFQMERAAVDLLPGTIVLISSQVPVGFTRSLEVSLTGRQLRFAVSPENLRLGKAIECFECPERIVVGFRDSSVQVALHELLTPFCDEILWMSIESAEMTKHAVNAFLATSVTFINELSRICESVGANAKEVEQGLKSEGRIGRKAYVSPGGAFAGGTLARDVRFLLELARTNDVLAPLFTGVWEGNRAHKNWTREKCKTCLESILNPSVAILGLTYKPGTSTLRRSGALELAEWLTHQGIRVRAHDPAIHNLPNEWKDRITLVSTAEEALAGADLVVVSTEWLVFRQLTSTQIVEKMRTPQVIDATHFLSAHLLDTDGLNYYATGVSTQRSRVA